MTKLEQGIGTTVPHLPYTRSIIAARNNIGMTGRGQDRPHLNRNISHGHNHEINTWKSHTQTQSGYAIIIGSVNMGEAHLYIIVGLIKIIIFFSKKS